jgi:hypothetical protein
MVNTITTITKEVFDEEVARRTRICGSKQQVFNSMCETYTII